MSKFLLLLVLGRVLLVDIVEFLVRHLLTFDVQIAHCLVKLFVGQLLGRFTSCSSTCSTSLLVSLWTPKAINPLPG